MHISKQHLAVTTAGKIGWSADISSLRSCELFITRCWDLFRPLTTLQIQCYLFKFPLSHSLSSHSFLQQYTQMKDRDTACLFCFPFLICTFFQKKWTWCSEKKCIQFSFWSYYQDEHLTVIQNPIPLDRTAWRFMLSLLMFLPKHYWIIHDQLRF